MAIAGRITRASRPPMPAGAGMVRLVPQASPGRAR